MYLRECCKCKSKWICTGACAYEPRLKSENNCYCRECLMGGRDYQSYDPFKLRVYISGRIRYPGFEEIHKLEEVLELCYPDYGDDISDLEVLCGMLDGTT